MEPKELSEDKGCATCEKDLTDQTILDCNHCGEAICEDCSTAYWERIRSAEEGQLCQGCMDDFKTAQDEKGHSL